MPHSIEADYEEVHLLPPALEDWVGEEHPARFIREFVSALDLDELGFKPLAPGTDGRPGWAPELMLRIWLYGYMEKVRSTRKLERACRDRMGFIWLCGNRVPDHNSLWRFWKANRAALRRVFKQTVKVAMECELVGLVLQAVDGTKIQAACSGREVYDETRLKKLLERLDDVVAETERSIGEARGAEGDDLHRLEQKQSSGQVKADKLRDALKKVRAQESRHIHPDDTEARRMSCDGRNRFGYNAQAVVDGENQIIVAAEAVNAANDLGELHPMLEQAEDNTGGGSRGAVNLADGGYSCGEQLEKAEASGYEVLAPPHASVRNQSANPYHASRFEHDPDRDVVICPEGRELPFRRTRKRGKKQIEIREYRSAKVCKDCPVKDQCTKDRHGRSIEVAPWDQAMRTHYEKMEAPENIERLRERGRIVEPVFGWIKEADEFRRWTVRGRQNVRTQWALVCAALNLKRIWKLQNA